ncbi:MAG: ECF-type sigma factor [Acidobacteriota bacterium]
MPPDAADPTITQLLHRLAEGEEGALGRLFPKVYGELRRIASGQKHRGPQATLDTTALLHEVYLRFARSDRHVYRHREHFYAVAAKAMRQILLDEAKRRLRLKRGAGVAPETLDPERIRIDQQAEMMIALDQGLAKLGRIQDRARRVVEYRFFGGLTEEETARALGVDTRTIRRDWAKARAWLAGELSSS